jgi:hypothetical protein
MSDMNWSYSANPNSKRDRIRSMIGDVRSARPLLYDEEVDMILLSASYVGASDFSLAAILCEMIAARMADKVDKNLGRLKTLYEQEWQHYKAQASRFWQLSAGLIPTEDGESGGNLGGFAAVPIPLAGGLETPRLFGRTVWPAEFDPSLVVIQPDEA